MADKPIKIESKDVPPEIAKALAATPKEENEVFAAKVKASFDMQKKSLHVDPKDMPDRVSAEHLPTKRYHVGCLPGSPFTTMYCGNIDFPLVNGTRIPGSAEGREPQMIEHMGTVKSLTEDQVKFILKAAMLDAWRSHGKHADDAKKGVPSRRWEHIPLGNDSEGKPRKKGAYFAPGDKLSAHFIYMRELADGEEITFGVKTQAGGYMPVPTPLLVDEAVMKSIANVA